MQADYKRLEEIVGMVRNPKDHNLGDITGSFNRFGFLERIIINTTTGNLIAGHGRIETLRRMKARGSAPPVNIQVDGNSWQVPCDLIAIPAQEEEAAAIALNRLVETGGWDESLLTNVLSDIATRGEGALDGIGFDGDDLDGMLRNLGGLNNAVERMSDGDGESARGESDGFADEMQEKWGVLPGDVWQVGDHLIICGDCREIDTWSPIVDKDIALVFTSPPYAEQRKKQYGGISEHDYVTWWSDLQSNVAATLAPDGSFFVNIKPHSHDGQRSLYVHDLVSAMVREWGWLFVDEFCWQRISAPGSWPNRFKNGFEPVYQFARSQKIKFRPQAVGSGTSGAEMGGSNKAMGNYYNTANKMVEWQNALPSNVLPTFGNATGWGQAAAFPVGLPEFFILAYTDSGDLVVDPFAGSGTTAVAAHYHGRKSVSIELLASYVAIILERMMDATGESPTKV
jgi:site-specific DNA-methyltransferase (adenine-specific)